MAAARLCQLCQSIPFHDLPALSPHFIGGSKDGVHELDGQPVEGGSFREKADGPLGFPHHVSLESLRHASAAGCELCREIETGAGDLLAAVLRRFAAGPDLRTRVGDPTFDLWVTKRAKTGDGFWVFYQELSRGRGDAVCHCYIWFLR
jgi:hypothetical protein